MVHSAKQLTTALKTLNIMHIGDMSEKDWDKELQGFGAITGLAKSLQTDIMNFANWRDTGNDWDWRSDLYNKRKLIGNRKGGGGGI